MTLPLLIARGFIIHWAKCWLSPLEYAFNMIEIENPDSQSGARP
jgi:hypothetical protein